MVTPLGALLEGCLVDWEDHPQADDDQDEAGDDQQHRAASQARQQRSRDRAGDAAQDRPGRGVGPCLMDRTYGTTPTAAEGMVAGNGEATAISPGTPSSASTGVATEEPPTPNRPVQIPTPAPASTIYGHQARCVIEPTRE